MTAPKRRWLPIVGLLVIGGLAAWLVLAANLLRDRKAATFAVGQYQHWQISSTATNRLPWALRILGATPIDRIELATEDWPADELSRLKRHFPEALIVDISNSNGPDGENGPWWKLTGNKLQEFLRLQIANADRLTATFSGVEVTEPPLVVTDRLDLQQLSNAFQIRTPRLPSMAYDAPVYTEIEIVGERTINFNLIGTHLLFGPWAPDLRGRQLLMDWWSRVEIGREFVSAIEEKAGITMGCCAPENPVEPDRKPRGTDTHDRP